MATPRIIRAADYERLGQDPRQLALRSKKGELTRVLRGNYVESADWNALGPKARYGLRVSAFDMLAGRQPVFCHTTAALLWGLWVVGTPRKLHIVTESTAGGRSRKGVQAHIGSRSAGVLRCGPFLVTDKLTTTMQLIGGFAFPYAVAICDSSLRAPQRGSNRNVFLPASVEDEGTFDPFWFNDVPQGRPLQLSELRAAAQELPSKAAIRRTMAVIEFANALSGSAGESLSRVQMSMLGFPAPILQHPFVLRDGSEARVDFWFEEQKLAGEFDGKEKYLRDDWAGGSSIQDRVWAEKAREDQIRAHGVGLVRWTWPEMMDKQRFEALLRQAGLRQKRGRA